MGWWDPFCREEIRVAALVNSEIDLLLQSDSKSGRSCNGRRKKMSMGNVFEYMQKKVCVRSSPERKDVSTTYV